MLNRVSTQIRLLGCCLGAACVLAAPTSSFAATVTVGAAIPVGGVIDYTTGTPSVGIPPLGCFSGPANLASAITPDVTVDVNSGGTEQEFVGLVGMSATLNEGVCTSLVQEEATFTNLTISGTGPLGTLSCGPFAGSFSRVGPVATLVASAATPGCTVDGQGTGPVTFVMTAVWAPIISATLATPKATFAGAGVLEGTA